MYIRFSLAIMLISLWSAVSTQEATYSLNMVLLIDNEIPQYGITTSYFIVEKMSSNGSSVNLDTIHFKYDVGEIYLTEEDYNSLVSLPDKQRIEMKIIQRDISRKQIDYQYSAYFTVEWLLDRYLIVHFLRKKRNKQRIQGEYVYDLLRPGVSAISK